VHNVSQWFQQPVTTFLETLKLPANGLVVPGHPERSRFLTELIAPDGPMGSIFSQDAGLGGDLTYRDVVHRWVADGCHLPQDKLFTLRMNTPFVRRAQHPTGRMFGMGSIH
jgi:hypothetical protein